MRLIVQRKSEGLYLGGDLDSIEEVKEGAADIIKEDGGDVYEMALAILERFPRFNEVIVSTKLTQDVQDDNKERDDYQR